MARAKQQKDAVEFFVSPVGNDRWSGTLPAPDKRKTNGPFATIERAQRAVRKLKGRTGLKQPVRVTLRGGLYTLKQPIVFTPRDSGAAPVEGHWHTVAAPARPVTYAAYPGETPVLSGGSRITGWKKEKLGTRTVWVARLPQVKRGKWYFRELFVNGRRAARTRVPREGLYRIETPPERRSEVSFRDPQDNFGYAEGDIRRWTNLQDVEVVEPNLWVESRMGIRSLDEQKRWVELDRNCVFNFRDDHGQQGAQYYVENVFEALDEPGQWYLDRPSGKLYYLPRRGERPETAEVFAPRLEALVRLEGDAEAGQQVEYLRFEGLSFMHSEWTLPPDQAGFSQAANGVPGAVTLSNAARCIFEGCTFAHLGGYGVELLAGSLECEVRDCEVRDLAAGGIKVWHGCKRNVIADNEIGPGGALFLSGVGVLIGNSGGNKVFHNHIHDFYYTGISVGWTWGYAENEAHGNVIEYNHVHDIGKGMLSDMGGIYTLGISPGTRIRYNVFHDIRSRGYGGWAIYTDEGSTDILIENNLGYRTKSAGFHQHYGRENIVRNNIFALGDEHQIMRSRVEPHRSFRFVGNIVYFERGEMLSKPHAGSDYDPANIWFERNLYFDASGRKIRFAGKTFRQWQKLGLDRGSLIADPLFADPERGDFTLRPDSPAFRLGFQPFDLSTVGPRRRPGR